MPGLYEIKARIESVQSTKQITRVMYLISASKSKKAKAQLESTLPYFRQVSVTLADILASSAVIDTPYISGIKQPEKKGGLYIVLSGDKGMAGGYNHNIISLINKEIDKTAATLWVTGILGRNQLARQGYLVDDNFHFFVMNPSVYRAREIAEMVVEQYLLNKYSGVYLVYTVMVNPLKQEPVIKQILPLKADELSGELAADSQNNIIEYEPSPKAVFDHLVPHYLKGIIYGAFVEAFTCEQHARMYAMDNATKNADEVIADLSLRYNRVRQAKITQEITEIVGGIPD